MTAKRSRPAHTAEFLQTFHTGVRTADRREAIGATGPEAVGVTDPAAVAFVRGKAATFAGQPSGPSSYFAKINGFRVLLGGSFLTEPQAKFITLIATTREGVTEGMRESLAVRLEQGFPKSAASAFITTYKDLPRKTTPAAYSAMVEAVAPGASTEEFAASEVPAGRYALRVDGVVKFYRLDRPTEGKWAGYVFLKAQASDELYPIRNRQEKDRIIAEIGKAPEAAATLYRTELGKCYRCGRTLTDETSRDLGIGPECRKK